jgi:hypothetical protein
MKLKKLLSIYGKLSIHKNKIKRIGEDATRSFKKVKSKKKDKHQSAGEVLDMTAENSS